MAGALRTSRRRQELPVQPALGIRDPNRMLELIARFATEMWSEPDRRIFELHYEHRMSFAAASAEIGISESAARRRWHRMVSELVDAVLADVSLANDIALANGDRDSVRTAVTSAKFSGAYSVLVRAKKTFGGWQAAENWLQDMCPALGGRPIDIVSSVRGVEAVENVLGCIDHGLYY